jgi:NADH dehydrogenase
VSKVFVTGGSGFVGIRLLPALLDRGHAVTALDRTGVLRRQVPDARRLRIVTADLLASSSYSHALQGSDVVVHLAAATGRATRQDHVRVNAEGTETLLESSRGAGVPRFLFVSSIAAGFPDRRHYPYAQAKLRGEQAVGRSGLAFAILRPTMIFGPGSAVLAGLEALAALPVLPVFGDGRTLVQPVHVDDVVRAIVQVIEEDRFGGSTFDLGGPDVLTIEALLRRIRESRRSGRTRTIHIPFALVLPPLRLAEAAGLTALLPVTAGQLSTFRFAGTAGANPLQSAITSAAHTLREMLGAPDAATGERARLEQECRVFTAHLVGLVPDAYVRRKYVEAHCHVAGLTATTRFERALLGVAGVHRSLAALADAYARTCLPGSVLRRKLVLLLALLESASPASAAIDREVAGRPAWVLIRLTARGGVAVARLLAGTVIFTPIRVLLAGRGR